MIHDFNMIQSALETMRPKVEKAREVFGRPLTLAEKILVAHLEGDLSAKPEPGEYVYLNPDRVALANVNLVEPQDGGIH